MSPSLLRVALTGGIATGKSYCLARFATLGMPVIDADQIARDLVKSGSPALVAIFERFGPTVRRADGELDRRALADIVFTDTAARSDLEALLHPGVSAAIDTWFDQIADSPVGMADIPLLYETGREADFNLVVVAACRPDQQLARMIERGYTLADATARLAAQLPIGEKARRSDFLIDTSGTTGETDRQVVSVYEALTQMD